jgi:hypothetical protein
MPIASSQEKGYVWGCEFLATLRAAVVDCTESAPATATLMLESSGHHVDRENLNVH